MNAPAAASSPRTAIVWLLLAVSGVVLAIWLLPASLHIVAWPRSGPRRIAVFAPLYLLLWLAGAAAPGVTVAVAARARHRVRFERLAFVCAPLAVFFVWTIPYLPWLSGRWPLLVALAGPLRWVFGVLAVGGVALRLFQPRWRRRVPGRRTAFTLALVVYLALGLRSLSSIGLGGDEPHYLVITHSILVDHDLQIENNHTARDYRAFFAGDLRPDYLQRGTNGEIYSIHAPGLSVLMLPGYALAGALGATATMCLLGALAALAIFDVLSMVSSPLHAWIAWAGVCFTVPLIPHAWAIYPEIAATAIVAWALRWSLEDRRTPFGLWFFRGCCLAWLPWLHTKFSVFAAGLAALLLWKLRTQWRAAFALLVPVALSSIAWVLFFKIIYGTFDPQAPYGSYTTQFLRLENVPRSVLGLLFDPKFGVLVYAPIYGLTVSGAWLLRHDRRWRAPVLGGLALALVYGLSSARMYMWWGGSSAPARFLVPVVPLLAPAIAVGIAQLRSVVARSTWMLLGVMSLAVAIAGAIAPAQLILFSAPHGAARLLEIVQGSAPLADAVPTYTQEDWISPTVRLIPWLASLLFAIAAGSIIAKRTRSGLATVTTELTIFSLAAALLAPPVPAEARDAAATRGGIELLRRFDPVRTRAFDYTRMARLSPEEWLQALALTFDREPGTEPDAVGRLTDALQLPPGDYEARVWFEGDRPRNGALQAVLGGGYQVGRLDGPLPNPAALHLTLPVAVPSLWMQLTDRDAARSVRRLEITPREIQPAGDRPAGDIRVVEAFEERPGAYVGYVGQDTYPEHGVFWTKGTRRGRLLLAPAGARSVAVTVHTGPAPAIVSLAVGSAAQQVPLAAEETRVLRFELPAGAGVVPVEITSSSSFRPAAVDPNSSDTRQLGCQVRLVLE